MKEEKQHNRQLSKHWPVVLLALLVVVIFIVVMVTFQVKETEYALLKTYSGELVEYGSGLHFRWPFGNSIWRHAKRIVLWKVGEPKTFLKSLDSTEAAERKLADEVRGARSAVISKYAFSDMVSERDSSSLLSRIEDEMRDAIHDSVLDKFGIDIVRIGFRQLGFPAAVTQNIYAAMISEREAKAKKFEVEGQAEAEKIRSDANTQAQKLVAVAQAEATKIRGEGDALAAESYRVFAQNPELASFLRNLDALKTALGEKDTLILDTTTAPFNLLAPNALEQISGEK